MFVLMVIPIQSDYQFHHNEIHFYHLQIQQNSLLIFQKKIEKNFNKRELNQILITCLSNKIVDTTNLIFAREFLWEFG